MTWYGRPIEQMPDEHIENAMRYMRETPDVSVGCRDDHDVDLEDVMSLDETNPVLYSALERELRRRRGREFSF